MKILNIIFTRNILRQLREIFDGEEEKLESYYEDYLKELLLQDEEYEFEITHATGEGENHKIYLTLVTDSECLANQKVYGRYIQSTLRLEGVNTLHNEYEVFKATAIKKYSGINKGKKNAQSIRDRFKINYRKAFEHGGVDSSYLVERNNIWLQKEARKKVEGYLQKWDDYLEIMERKIKENQLEGKFSNLQENVDQTMVWITPCFSVEEWQKVSRMRGAQVNIKSAVDDEGEYIGNLERVQLENNCLGISLNFEYQAALEQGYWVPVNKGFIHIFSFGEISQINRLKKGMQDLKNGRVANLGLMEFLFDGSKVDEVDASSHVSLATNELLLKSLNERQKQAVEGALACEDLFLIQGPPGTGKTTVIAELCYQHAKKGLKTLISAQTNLAVDNAMSRLVHAEEIVPLRLGNYSAIEPEGKKYAENHIVEEMVKTAKENLHLQKQEGEEKLKALKELKAKVYQLNLDKDAYKIKNTSLKTTLHQSQYEMNEIKRKLELLAPKYAYFEELLRRNDNLPDKLGKEGIYCTQEMMQTVSNLRKAKEAYQTMYERIRCIASQDAQEIGYAKLLDLKEILLFKISKLQTHGIQGMAEGIEVRDIETLEREVDKLIKLQPNPLIKSQQMIDRWLEKACQVAMEIEAGINNMMKQQLEVEGQAIRHKQELEQHQAQIQYYEKDLLTQLTTEKATVEEEINALQEAIKKHQEGIDVVKEEIKDVASQINQLEQAKKALIGCSSGEEQWIEELTTQKEDLKQQMKWQQEWQEELETLTDESLLREMELLYKQHANVIGITCVQAGSKQFSKQYEKVDVVIVDETSKATPPELLIPILKGKKVILVGDHKQLAPMINNDDINELAKSYGYEKEASEALKVSLFEKLFNEVPDTNKVMLNVQYRMHEQIMDVVNVFYGDTKEEKLQYGLANQVLPRQHQCEGDWIEPSCHTVWVDMPLNEKYKEECVEYSFVNPMEVKRIEAILDTLNTNYKRNEHEGRKAIGVIAFYSEQVRAIKRMVEKHQDTWDKLHIRIGTVDKFQGIERDIVILSCVRNNKGEVGKKRPSIGHAQNPKRINVAMSRAKDLLIVVGCSELFTEQINGTARKQYEAIYTTIRLNGGVINERYFN